MSPASTDPARQVARARRQLEAARAKVDTCRADLADAARAARAAGIPMGEIATAAGVKRPNLYRLLDAAEKE